MPRLSVRPKYLTGLLGPLLSLALVGIGLWMFGYFVWRVWVAHRSTSWPATAGYVTSSGVCERRGKTITYNACVRYEYSVGGEVFVSERIIWGHQDPGGRDEAERTARKYPAGAEVKVFYDPGSTGMACLEPGVVPWETYIPIAVGPIFALFGLYLRRVKSTAGGASWGGRYARR